MEFGALIEPLLSGTNMLDEHSEALMSAIVAGELKDSQLASVLTLLRTKGTTGQELASFARVLRKQAVSLNREFEGLVDTCGTGGGIPSFNLSTAAMFVAAGAGAMIAKHGNRAVTSKCGSADVLEALGVKLVSEPEAVVRCIDSVGIGFMLAPAFHPALKQVGPVRRELGFRTVFNQLGPLLNPAHADTQLIGVYSPDLVVPTAHALGKLNLNRSLVVHATEGLDEVSPCGETEYAKTFGGTTMTGVFKPSNFGMDPLPREAINPGETIDDNAKILVEAISDSGSVRSKAIIPNAACTIWLAQLSHDFEECAELARKAIESGAAIAKLRAFVEVSNA